MCYRISFFLQEFLSEKNGISVDIVIGYVNDGESEIMASHAWLEYESKKIVRLTIKAVVLKNTTAFAYSLISGIVCNKMRRL